MYLSPCARPQQQVSAASRTVQIFCVVSNSVLGILLRSEFPGRMRSLEICTKITPTFEDSLLDYQVSKTVLSQKAIFDDLVFVLCARTSWSYT